MSAPVSEIFWPGSLGGVVDRVKFPAHLVRSPTEIGCCVMPCGRMYGGIGGAGKVIVHDRLLTRPSPTSITVPNLAAMNQTV